MATMEERILRYGQMDKKALLKKCEELNIDIIYKAWKDDIIRTIIDVQDKIANKGTTLHKTGGITVTQFISGYESQKPLPMTKIRSERAKRYRLFFKNDLIARCKELNVRKSWDSRRDNMIKAILNAEDEFRRNESEVTPIVSTGPLSDLIETTAHREERYKSKTRSDLYRLCQSLRIETSGTEPDSQLIRIILREEDRLNNVSRSREIYIPLREQTAIELSPLEASSPSPHDSTKAMSPVTSNKPQLMPSTPPNSVQSTRIDPILHELSPSLHHSTKIMTPVTSNEHRLLPPTPPNIAQSGHVGPILHNPSPLNPNSTTTTSQTNPAAPMPLNRALTIQHLKLQQPQIARLPQWRRPHPHVRHPGITVVYPDPMSELHRGASFPHTTRMYPSNHGQLEGPTEHWYAPLYRTPRMNAAAEIYNNMPLRHIEAINKARAITRGIDESCDSKLSCIEVLLEDDRKEDFLPAAPVPVYELPPAQLAELNPDKEIFIHWPTVMQVAVLKSLEGPEQDAARFQFAREEFYEQFSQEEMEQEVIARRVMWQANARRALVRSDMRMFERMCRRRKGLVPREERKKSPPLFVDNGARARSTMVTPMVTPMVPPKAPRKRKVAFAPDTIGFETVTPTRKEKGPNATLGRPKSLNVDANNSDPATPSSGKHAKASTKRNEPPTKKQKSMVNPAKRPLFRL